MTAQIPEVFINEYPANELDGLYLYYILADGASREREVLRKCGIPEFKLPWPIPDGSTALYRGFIATYKLTSEGRLFLLKYEYPTGGDEFREQIVEEYLTNDFILIFRKYFYKEGLKVPFQNGIIVGDRSMWEKEGW